MIAARPSMPLLVKELAEQAARIRTYRIRSVFAVLLYAPAMAMLLFRNGHLDLFGRVDLAAGGLGREVCDTLWITLQAAIYLFLPAMTAGAIASEKENGSLHLLFLTDLKPWETVLQKYFGRLIPFLTLILLSLPLFAVAYAYGGLSVDMVLTMGYGLLITMLQVAAIAMFSSAQCATATGAIVASYFVGVAFYVTPLLVAVIFVGYLGLVSWTPEAAFSVLLSWFPPYVINVHRGDIVDLVTASSPVILTTAIFLLLARVSLVRYVFSPPRSVVSVFRRLDEIYAAMNRHFGNITVLADRATLPADRPIAWREMHKRGLGRRHHLARLLLMLMVPLVFGLLFILMYPDEAVYAIAAAITWVICGMILVTNAASCMPSERSEQTLEVLLSTPMDVKDIVDEKLASLRRLAAVISVPILTLAVPPALGLTTPFWRGNRSNGAWLLYVPAAIVGVRYLLWIGFACGLFIRNKTTAVVTAVGAAVCVFAAYPLLLGLLLFGVLDLYESTPLSLLFLLSPGLPILAGLMWEVWSDVFRHWEFAAFLLWLAISLKTISVIRAKCLAAAPRILRGE